MMPCPVLKGPALASQGKEQGVISTLACLL